MNDEENDKTRCSEKMTFNTKLNAQTAATVTAHQRGIKLKPYRCHDCGLWHNATARSVDD